jgi:hypothetical protein
MISSPTLTGCRLSDGRAPSARSCRHHQPLDTAPTARRYDRAAVAGRMTEQPDLAGEEIR